MRNGAQQGGTIMSDESIAARKLAVLEGLLACPECRGQLKHAEDRYACLSCGKSYPIVNGIPRFAGDLSEDTQQVRRSFNLEHSKYLESKHVHFTPQLITQWLDDVQLPAEYFKGKVVLDAGCGSGRWTYALASLGATVVAVDLTDSGVQVTHQATEALDHVAVLQADIMRLPFKPDSFDFVVSWGVLHHTPDTLAAFHRLVPLIKKGGGAHIMVYEKHNPLKFACTNVLRRIVRTLPEESRYRFCRHLIIRNPILHLLMKDVIISDTRYKLTDPLAISTKQLGLYDAYAPLYNHLHTADEVFSWFERAGFKEITLTSPARFTKPFDVFRWGRCGGAVRMRGVRS